MPVLEHRKLVDSSPKICIIGAGFSGLCAAIKLRRDIGTENFELFEINEDVGGTWYSNRYPGACCDIPIHAYCFSFERRSDWRAQYADYSEIHKYIQEVAEKYDLLNKTYFEHSVQRLEWNNQQWNVTIQDIQSKNVFTKAYDIVISASGSIRVPKIPDEFKNFAGPKLHTAQWDHTIDLTNKRVAVIGTGASGVQVIPQISKIASNLIVFQRKASWVFPKLDFNFGGLVKFIFKWIPGVLLIYNMILFNLYDLLWFAMKKDSWASKQGTAICNWHRRKQLGSRQDLYDKLTPNYDFGCQRTAFAHDYYPVFTKANTALVTDKIEHVTKDSIVTVDGQQYQIDALVLATGFRITDYFAPLEIIDKNGDNVLTSWKKDTPSLFMGIASHNLPNLFILYGPNTSTGHNSVVITVEMQMDWVVNCLREMMDRKAKMVSIKERTVREYMEELHKQLKIMVWSASLCSPWYTDEQGRNVSIFPWTLSSFGKRVRNFDFKQLEFQ